MNETRGQFSQTQIRALLAPVNPKRVVVNEHTKPHLSQQDVLAHLSRLFGFGRFDVEVVTVECIYEQPTTNAKGKDAWSVGYRALVRLTVRNERQELVAHFDGGSTGESEGQPSRADSHDLAMKSALSTATKRAAIHLGDQFGLSLYNKGQRSALVMGTLVDGLGPQDQREVDADVEQQEEDGGSAADRIAAEQDEAAEAPQPTPAERRKPTVGRQGTKRAAERLTESMEAQTEPEETTPEPEPTPPAPSAPETPPEPEKAPAPTGEEIVREKIAQGVSEKVTAEAARQARKEEAAAELAAHRERERAAEEEERAERERIAAEQEEAARAAAEAEQEAAPDEWDGGAAVLAPDEPAPATWADHIDAGRVWEALELAGENETMSPAARWAEVKGTWDTAEATGKLTTELRLAITARRNELKAELEELARQEAEAAKENTP